MKKKILYPIKLAISIALQRNITSSFFILFFLSCIFFFWGGGSKNSLWAGILINWWFTCQKEQMLGKGIM